MAFGQFDAYEPLPTPPGAPPAYSFLKKDGQRMTFMGPEAEKLRANIDASTRFAPQPVAGPGGLSKAESFYTNWQAPKPPPSPPPGIAAEPEGLMGPAGPAGAANPPAQDTVPASIARPPGEGGAQPQSGYVPIGYGAYRSPTGEIVKRVGGTKAITKEDLQAEAANRVAIPQSQSTTIEGAIPQDPEYLRAMNERMDQDVLDLDRQKAVALKRLEVETDIANKVEAARAKQFQDEQNRNAEIQARVARDDEIAQKAQAAYNGATVDPNRMFKGEGGTATAIVAALAAGLGAFGATLGRTENFALNTINSMINRDVNAQEAEIKIKGDAANNALAELHRETGSLDQSKILLRQLQMNWVLSQGEAMSLASKAPEIEARFAGLRNDGEKQILQWNEDRRKESFGRWTATTAEAMASPRAGSSGGFVPIGTPQQQVGFGQSVQNLGKGEAELQQTNAQTAKTISEVGAGRKPKAGTKAAAAAADVAAGGEVLDTLAGEAGAEWNPETQQYEGDVGGVWYSGIGGSDRSQKLQAHVNAAAPVVGRAQEGNAPNESTMKAFKEDTLSMSGDKLLSALTAQKRSIEARRRALQQNPNAFDHQYEDKGQQQ